LLIVGAGTLVEDEWGDHKKKPHCESGEIPLNQRTVGHMKIVVAGRVETIGGGIAGTVHQYVIC